MAKTKDKSELSKDVKELETHGSGENSENKPGFLFYFLAFLSAIIIMVAVPFGVFYYAIKVNARGIADTYEKEIKNIPVLNMALPQKPDPEDPELLTEEELKKTYIKIKNERDGLNIKVEDTKKLEDKIKKLEDDLNKEKRKREAAEESAQLIKDEYRKKDKVLKEQKNELDRIAAEGDKESFKKYFEGIDKDLAEQIYRALTKDDIANEEATKFAQTYEKMEAEAAAKIFEGLGKDKIQLVCDIFSRMKKESTAKVLSEMDPVFAGEVTDKLAKEYLYKVPQQGEIEVTNR